MTTPDVRHRGQQQKNATNRQGALTNLYDSFITAGIPQKHVVKLGSRTGLPVTSSKIFFLHIMGTLKTLNDCNLLESATSLPGPPKSPAGGDALTLSL